MLYFNVVIAEFCNKGQFPGHWQPILIEIHLHSKIAEADALQSIGILKNLEQTSYPVSVLTELPIAFDFLISFFIRAAVILAEKLYHGVWVSNMVMIVSAGCCTMFRLHPIVCAPGVMVNGGRCQDFFVGGRQIQKFRNDEAEQENPCLVVPPMNGRWMVEIKII